MISNVPPALAFCDLVIYIRKSNNELASDYNAQSTFLIWLLISMTKMRLLLISDESSGWYEDVLPGTAGNQHMPKRSRKGFQTRWVL